MNTTPLRLFASLLVLCLFSQAPWVQGQTFREVKFLKVVGAKTKEVKAHLIVAGDSIRVLDPKSARTLKAVPYSEIKAASYSFSKHRRWRAGLAVAAVVHMFAAPLFFMKGKKHWLTFEMEEDYLALRLDKSNFEGILAAVDRRLKDTTAFDGYRDGASRSGMKPPLLENKGESPLDKKRILVADQSRSRAGDLDREDAKRPQEALDEGLNADGYRLTLPKAPRSEWSSSQWSASQMPRELREWITAYLEDLPNFICDYTEIQYGRGSFGWKEQEKHKHQGEVRYIDGQVDYRVVSEDGLPVEKTIWEVTTASPTSFNFLGGFLRPAANYRFTRRGEGEISFQSDAGKGLVRGWTKDGRIVPPRRSYPTWGTLWVREPQHRVRGVMEYFTVPEGRWLRASKFPPGEYSSFREYGPVNIGEKPYWLMKQIEFNLPSNDERTVQTYYNCRRFQAKSSIQYGNVIDAPSATPANKRYDTEIAAAQPGLKQVAGGAGGERPTLAHESPPELEVDADLDSAKSPNLSPQDPSAASQPPLSKAVRTSPKRPPPKRDEIIPSPWGYKLYQPEPKDRLTVPDPWEGIAPRYGYKPGYGYYPTVSSEKAESPRGDPDGLWWVVSMAAVFGLFVSGVFVSVLGAFAFIRVFGGKASADFLQRKSADAPERRPRR